MSSVLDMERLTEDDIAKINSTRPTPLTEEDIERLNATLAIPAEEIDRHAFDYALSNITATILMHREAAAAAETRRRELIHEAKARGYSYRKIADMADISHQRVAQIIEDGQ